MDRITLILSSNIFTKASEPLKSGAIVMCGDKIAELCTSEEAENIARSNGNVDVFNYRDAFVCPGFHDAHQHVLHAALFPSRFAAEIKGSSEADCVSKMREWEREAPVDGWLISHGWRNALWDNPTMPTRLSLDEHFPTRPVCLYSGDAHTVWVNSAGLATLGIDEHTRPPIGGSFDRSRDGRLTGVLRESAGMLYMGRILGTIPRESIVEMYADYFRRLLSRGITSVCDMALSAIPGFDCVLEDVYEQMFSQGRLTLRVNVFPQLTDSLERIESLQRRLLGDVLRAPGCKQFFDGVSSAHTAWLMEPYANPHFKGDCGRPTIPPDEMARLVLPAAKAGIAVRIHTIGDRAVHEAIRILAEARERFGEPAQGRNALEHIESLMQDDIQRLSEVGVVASCQPQHIAIDTEQPYRDLGPERAQRMWQFSSLLRSGVDLAFGSDAPVVAPNPIEALDCAVYRCEPDCADAVDHRTLGEPISMREAIGAYTLGSARVSGRDDVLGTIEPGKLADIAVFDRNLLSCSRDELRGTKVLATFVGGELAFRA